MSRRIALISGIGLALSSGGVWAAQFGSPAWFAAQRTGVPASAPASAASAPSGNLSGRVVTPDQALVRAQRSIQNLSRAAQIIASAQTNQAAARQLALNGLSTVPNGLQTGGLQVAPGVTTDPSLWQNAQLPTETAKDGRTTVTVEQTGGKAILTWETFNVGRETTLHFDQTRGTQSDGTNAWIALNRVLDPQAAPSQILGSIKAEGSVYLLNANGIMFGGASQVNTHSFMASSLSLFSDDIATSNRLFLNSGINGILTNNTFHLGGDRNFTSREAIENWQAPGDIDIDAGAQIVTGQNGYSLIAAPNVTNAGTILAKDGQAIVAAGVGVKLMQFESNTGLSGANLWKPELAGNIMLDGVPTSRGLGTLENTGLIGASRGNVSLVGYEVQQSGVVQATTSVSRPGSLYIAAQDSRSPIDTQNPASGGVLNFSSNSLTAILPERDGETTTTGSTANLTFKAPTAIIGGAQVTLQDEALVVAPGATVDLLGWGRWDAVQNEEVLTERIELGRGATIDVSGLADVQLAMSANQVTIPRVGQNELADSPLQRDGVLYTETVTVDGRVSGVRNDGLAWFGSPLLNIGGYVENQPRKIDQLLTSGGTINLIGRQLLTRPGSLLNLDGGYVHFLAGRVETTRLLGADGLVYDISQADPNVRYTGIAGQYTRDYSRWNVRQTYIDPLLSGRFGHYETAYVVGGSGGTLNIAMSGATSLEGDISAKAVSGRYQIAAGRPTEAGSFNFGMTSTLAARAFDSDSGPLPLGTHLIVAPDGAHVPADADPTHWTTLSASLLNDAGFSNIQLGSSAREVIVQEGAELKVQNGGSIELNGARVQIYGDLTARSGEISASATGLWQFGDEIPMDAETGLQARGDVIVGGNARLDASGEFVNDAFLDIDERSGSAGIDGGKITLAAHQVEAGGTDGIKDWSGALTLQSGATLDVSGGGYVLPSGELAARDGVSLGKGGDISLLTYVRQTQGATTPQQQVVARLPAGNAGVGVLTMDGAQLLGYSLGGGGTLSLRALNIQIGGDPVTTDPRTLYLDAGFFANQGFGAYDLAAELDANIAAGTQVRVSQRNLVPDVHALVQASSGADLYSGRYGELGTLDDYHRPATDFSLRAGDFVGRVAGNPTLSLSGATGTLLMGEGASLLLDPGASVRLGSRNQLTVLGSIVARGGDIVLSADSTRLLGESPAPAVDQISETGYSTLSKSLWLGANAVLDVSGISLIDPLATPLATADGVITPRSGRVLDGGDVTLSNDTGYVVVESGARIDLSGAADRYDLVESGAVGTVLTPRDVWSDAGKLTLTASSGLFFDGSIRAEGGAAEAAGGTLVLRPAGSATPSGRAATGILFHQSGSRLAEGLAPGEVVEADLSQPSGVLHFAADRLNGSGIETLIAGSNPDRTGNFTPLPIGFAGDVSLQLDRAIMLNASSFVALPENATTLNTAGAGGNVSLAAAYVSLSGHRNVTDNHTLPGNLPAPSDARLSVEAGMIDLGGQFSLANFGDAAFNSRGDIRFYTPAKYAYTSSRQSPFTGQLLTAGNLHFSASQLYPGSNNAFAVVAAGALDSTTGPRNETTITVTGNGKSSTAPLSAGGSLLLDATHIDQQGTLRAPAGRIVLGVDDPNDADTRAAFGNLPLTTTRSVRLASGSVTSVSLDGLVVPYGTTVDQTNYQDRSNPYLTEYSNLTAPPEKQITISGTEVALNPGATIDLEGGGELYAQEWIAGTGGSRDLLSRTNTVYSGNTRNDVPLYADGRAVYAIVPGQVSGIAPYDPALATGDVHIGQSVYLSGMEGIPEGVYTLMPARYATLPGAYRLVQDTGAIDIPTSANAKLPDGTLRMSGYFVDGLTGDRDARNTSFLVQSRDVWGKYSEYVTTDANKYFADKAASQGTSVPQLARDAGRLTLAATQSLSLGATLNTAAAKDGAGAQVDIASERIQITGSDAPELEGYLHVSATDLNALGAASLLIGGARSQSAQGVAVDTRSSSLVVSNNANTALQGPEILLVTNGGSGDAGDGLHLDSGSVILARGEISDGARAPIVIGRVADTANGISAVSGDGALVRVSNGAPVLVQRRNVTGSGGLLEIDGGATLNGGASLSLDATGDTRLDATAVLSAKAIDANSSSVSFVSNTADGAGRSGLVVGPQTLAQLGNAESITLRSRGDMNFVGAIDISLDDAALSLSAGRFVGDGNDVHLGAQTLTLSNELNGSASGSLSAGGSTLRLDAATLQFGAGESRFGGFDSVEASATRMITGAGTGKANFGDATLTLTAPALVGGEGADTTVTTTGNIHLVAGTGNVPDLPVGGALSLVGGSIDGGAHFAAPAGRISLQATQGDVALDSSTVIDVSGVARKFFDVTRYAPGGSILLNADHGDVIVSRGATLDFSGADGGGNAGSLSISAAEGSAQLEGNLDGHAAASGVGGKFSLDTGSALVLDALADQLLAGGINGGIAVKMRSGNLELSAGHRLAAQSVRLVADGGAGGAASTEGHVVINGTIDASGTKGGEIELYGKSGVDVQGALLARGTRPDELGGNVKLYTSGVTDGTYNTSFGYQNVTSAGSGRIELGNNAVIDVSGGSAGGLSGGTVHVRAPLLNNGDVNVTVEQGAKISGAREVALEAYAVWSTTDFTTGNRHFDGIVDAAGWYDTQGNLLPGTFVDRNGNVLGGTGDLSKDYFTPTTPNANHVGFYQTTLGGFVRQPGFAFEERFAHIDNFVARPGIELQNPSTAINGGKISVLTNWNLGATDADGNFIYRYNSAAPMLTLRADTDVSLQASISDGFRQYNNDLLSPRLLNIVTRAEALAAYTANGLGLARVNGNNFAVFQPEVFTQGTEAEQSLYHEMYEAYTELFWTAQYGRTGRGRLTAAAQAANQRGFVPGSGPNPANPAPSAPLTLQDYPAYLQAYVRYARTTLATWAGNNLQAIPFMQAPAPPPALLAPAVDNTPKFGNTPAPMPSFYDRVPLHTASLIGGGSSYRIVAGADWSSSDPLALHAGSNTGDIVVQGRTVYTNATSGRDVLLPTLVRTGTGSVELAAARDIRLDDPQAPAVIYSAGRPAEGTTTTTAVKLVTNSSQAGYRAALLATGSVNPEGAGNVELTAGRDIVGNQQVYDVDGSVTGIAGAYIGQYWWQWMQLSNTASASAINFGAFGQGVMSLGGDVSVAAGRDIRELSVSLPTTWALATGSNGTQQLNVYGGGDLSVAAGRDILSGSYFVSKGEGSLIAGGRVGSSFTFDSTYSSLNLPITTPVATLLALQDANWNVAAARGVEIGGIYNPSYIRPITGFFTEADSQAYSADSSLSLTSISGDVALSTMTLPGALFSYGGNRFLNGSQSLAGLMFEDVLPASLEAAALNGSVSVEAGGLMFPSATGQLTLLADDDLRLFSRRASASALNRRLTMADVDAAVWLPSPFKRLDNSAFGTNPLVAMRPTRYDLMNLHRDDANPVRLYALTGDIIGGWTGELGTTLNSLTLRLPKPALIQAGRDIVDLDLRAQNYRGSDVTRVVAGRDIYYTAPNATVLNDALGYRSDPELHLEIAGPGTLDVVAGRNLGPLSSSPRANTGIRTTGNTTNAGLPYEGADISLRFGVAPGMATDAFAARYLDPSQRTSDLPDYGNKLLAYMRAYFSDHPEEAPQGVELTVETAWTEFQQLPEYRRQLLVQEVFLDLLKQVGKDYSDPLSVHYQQYARGYEAINALFPAGLGYTANSLEGGSNGAEAPVATGNLDLRGSTIQTQRGGDISILGPGGQVLIGSSSAPPVIVDDAGKVLVGPSEQGILTMERGSIGIFSDRSVLLAQSRVFTERGGDIVMWSSNGDINAGKGAKTSSEKSPVAYDCDVDRYCRVDAEGQVTGAGIATLQTLPGGEAGDAVLVAPRGTVDAGDAGIRVSGNLVIAAFSVANADNIQVQGDTVGVPTSAVNVGALSSASSAAAAAQKSADDLAGRRPPERAASMISVEVVGLGQPDEAQLKKLQERGEGK